MCVHIAECVGVRTDERLKICKQQVPRVREEKAGGEEKSERREGKRVGGWGCRRAYIPASARYHERGRRRSSSTSSYLGRGAAGRAEAVGGGGGDDDTQTHGGGSLCLARSRLQEESRCVWLCPESGLRRRRRNTTGNKSVQHKCSVSTVNSRKRERERETSECVSVFVCACGRVGARSPGNMGRSRGGAEQPRIDRDVVLLQPRGKQQQQQQEQ